VAPVAEAEDVGPSLEEVEEEAGELVEEEAEVIVVVAAAGLVEADGHCRLGLAEVDQRLHLSP